MEHPTMILVFILGVKYLGLLCFYYKWTEHVKHRDKILCHGDFLILTLNFL